MIGKKTFALELVKIILGKDIEQNQVVNFSDAQSATPKATEKSTTWQDQDFRFIPSTHSKRPQGGEPVESTSSGQVPSASFDKTQDKSLRTSDPKTSEGETKIYIEDVRDLKKFLSFKSYSGGHRTVVINNAHSLTPEAANALLKILEEPPTGSILILVSSIPGLLPATILSRCEEVKFFPLSQNEITDFVSQNKKLNKEDKEFLVKISGGRIGLIKNIIDSGDLSKIRSSIDDLRKLLNKGIFERMEYAKKIYESEKYQETVNYWLSWVSAHLAPPAGGSPKNKKIVEDLLILNQLVSQSQFNHRLALENFLLNL